MRRFWQRIEAAGWLIVMVPWLVAKAMWIAWLAHDDDAGDRAGRADGIGCDTDDLVLGREGEWEPKAKKSYHG